MKQLHPIQLQILRKLLFAPELRYSKLKPTKAMGNNRFNFHLDRLIASNYIEKANNRYDLTGLGKEYAGRLDPKQKIVANQPKTIVAICCLKQTENKLSFLIHTRHKQPFYGCQGFPAGKVNFGETIIDAAKRELKEETGLEGNPKIVSETHYLVSDKKSKQLLDDLFIFLCLVNNPTGKLRPNHEGTLRWVFEENLKSFVTNPIENFTSLIKQVEKIKTFHGQITIEEIHHESEKF